MDLLPGATEDLFRKTPEPGADDAIINIMVPK